MKRPPKQRFRVRYRFVPIPQIFIDHWLRLLTPAEVSVYLAVLRLTHGYGKDSDKIATSQLAEMAGLKRSATSAALSSLIDRGLVKATGSPRHIRTLEPLSGLPDTLLKLPGPELVSVRHRGHPKVASVHNGGHPVSATVDTPYIIERQQ